MHREGKLSRQTSSPFIPNEQYTNLVRSNLTIANHAIFLQPYYTAGPGAQEKWQAAMTQALGRVRRHGQTKSVFKYIYLTTDSIDIDLYEARTNSILRPMPNTHNASLTPITGPWKTELGTYHAGQMHFDGAIRDDRYGTIRD